MQAGSYKDHAVIFKDTVWDRKRNGQEVDRGHCGGLQGLGLTELLKRCPVTTGLAPKTL